MHEPEDDEISALREMLRDGGTAKLRRLLDREPALSEIADCQRLLEADAANARPRLRLAPVEDDGTIVMLVACPNRLAARTDGKPLPECRWRQTPSGPAGYECRAMVEPAHVCGRIEVGGERCDVLDQLFGKAPT